MYRSLQDVRFLPAVALGGAVSFALFLLMHQLIATNRRGVEVSPPPQGLGLVRIERRPPVDNPVSPQPRPPRPVARPHTGLDNPTANPAVPRIALSPRLSFGPRATGPSLWNPAARPGVNAPTGNASPLLKFAIKPLYPPDAEYRGVEGSLRTCFTVAADGSVVDPRIAGASSPEARRVFGPYAVRTILQWKYFPRQVNGVAVATPNVCATVQFKLLDETEAH